MAVGRAASTPSGQVDRPRIIRGRAPNPADPTEVVLSAPGSESLVPGKVAAPKLGDRLTLSFLTWEQQLANRLDTPEGPTVTLHIVGIGESPFETAAIPTHGDLYAGRRSWRATGANWPRSATWVRLADPGRDVRLLEAEVARHYPGRDVPVYDLRAAAKRVTNGTSLERSGPLLFGAAVALAGLVIVGQALTRSVRAAGGDVPVLVAPRSGTEGRDCRFPRPNLRRGWPACRGR